MTMKKLLKHISPLAPDDSGACSVLYEMGGIVVICDAGGCAGNVCGFDEPRWHEKRSALFSAGLRDMDAILGRDDRLVQKLALVCSQVDGEFSAVIGTPVPAVIATDYKALKRMSEKKTGKPCITIETDGTKLYDFGEELAYLRLFEQFAEDGCEVISGSVGIIGATPLDTGLTRADVIKDALADRFSEIVCFGLDSGLDDVKRAGSFEKLLVISPAGLKAAKYLSERFGTRYEVGFPALPKDVVRNATSLSGKKVLVINQQFAANELRRVIAESGSGCEVDCATWFMLDKNYAAENDFRIDGEQTLVDKLSERDYDVIFADRQLGRILGGSADRLESFPHYAVSAELYR